jgi:transaldolase
MSNAIKELHQLEQSIWYDNIERRLLKNGKLAAMIASGDIRGVTSNPSIFNKAIARSSDYDAALIPLAKEGKDKEEIFEALAVEDIRAAADLFRPLYDQTGGGDGYVSLEVSPYLAYDTETTRSEALRLWNLVDRPNLMVKIPATKEGLPAITRSIADGININVTLIFALSQYTEVMEAYLAGLEARIEAGKPVEQVASVASFFVSRIDTNVDNRLQALMNDDSGQAADRLSALLGKAAVASAKLAYQRYKGVFASERFAKLTAKGARAQRPLWASTGTKNPAYSDVKYVEELIGPGTVNTLPPHTLDAFRDHGITSLTLEEGISQSHNVMDELAEVGISMDQVTQELEDQGVKAFADAYTALLESVESRRAASL